MSDDDRGFFSPLDMHEHNTPQPLYLSALEVGIGIALGLGITAFLAWCYLSAAGV